MSQREKFIRKVGIHDYTTYGSDAKSILRKAWLIGKITHDLADDVGHFPHYHSSKGFVNLGGKDVHMHSFYGEALR